MYEKYLIHKKRVTDKVSLFSDPDTVSDAEIVSEKVGARLEETSYSQ